MFADMILYVLCVGCLGPGLAASPIRVAIVGEKSVLQVGLVLHLLWNARISVAGSLATVDPTGFHVYCCGTWSRACNFSR